MAVDSGLPTDDYQIASDLDLTLVKIIRSALICIMAAGAPWPISMAH
jgi:hypothetical protein